MTEQEWLAATDSTKLLAELTGKGSDRKLRLFACACCRRIWPWLTDARSRRALGTVERWIEGLASENDRITAFDEAAEVSRELTEAALALAKPWTPEGMAAASVLAAATTSNEKGAWWKFDQSMISVAEGASCYVRVTEGLIAEEKGFSEEAANEVVEHSRLTDCAVIRDVFGNPFRPAGIDPSWLSWNDNAVVKLAKAIYDSRSFDRLPELADSLADSGCHDGDVLIHCRSRGPHVRGCWVIDSILGRD